VQVVIKADEGDAILVDAYQFSKEELFVVLEVENAAYPEGRELDRVTLSVEQARQLGLALLVAAEGQNCSRRPYNIFARIYHEN
jgi:hypothetical protein